MTVEPVEPEMIEDVLVETETERMLRGKLAEAEGIIARLYETTVEAELVRCWYCGAYQQFGVVFHREHQTPKVRGGTDEDYNIVDACPGCNLAKGSMTVEEFRLRFGELHGTETFWAERSMHVRRVPRPDRPSTRRRVLLDDRLWEDLRFVAGAKRWTLSSTVQLALMEWIEQFRAPEERP